VFGRAAQPHGESAHDEKDGKRHAYFDGHEAATATLAGARSAGRPVANRLAGRIRRTFLTHAHLALDL
jgi:hypothetical protein